MPLIRQPRNGQEVSITKSNTHTQGRQHSPPHTLTTFTTLTLTHIIHLYHRRATSSALISAMSVCVRDSTSSKRSSYRSIVAANSLAIVTAADVVVVIYVWWKRVSESEAYTDRQTHT